MEAAVAEKEARMTEWTDGRLDELSKRMDQSFASADQKMKEGFARVDQSFARVDREMKQGFARADKMMAEGFVRLDAEMRHLVGRFDALQQTLVRISLTVAIGLFSIFAALVVDHL